MSRSRSRLVALSESRIAIKKSREMLNSPPGGTEFARAPQPSSSGAGSIGTIKSRVSNGCSFSISVTIGSAPPIVLRAPLARLARQRVPHASSEHDGLNWRILPV